MPSWQSYILKSIFRLRRIVNPPTGVLDIKKERLETEALAAKFKTRIEFTSTPVNLNSDSTSFAERPQAAGVDVTLEVWDGMQHEWHFATNYLPESRQAIDRIGEFIKGGSFG